MDDSSTILTPCGLPWRILGYQAQDCEPHPRFVICAVPHESSESREPTYYCSQAAARPLCHYPIFVRKRPLVCRGLKMCPIDYTTRASG